MMSAQLLAALRTIEDPRTRRRLCMGVLERGEAVARKALWAYNHYLSRVNQPPAARAPFLANYSAAWCDSILNMVNDSGGLVVEAPEDLSFSILACWHFPEHTALIPFVIEHDALVLVANHQSWMEEIRHRGCTYCFREGKLSSALPRAMTRGRPIVAMFDYCYETSRHTIAEFLSYPARTPTGLLQLAARFGYCVRILSIRGRKIRISDQIGPISNVDQAAAVLNRRIEVEILRRPARWLLWPAVPQRWIGVDYGEDDRMGPRLGQPDAS